MIMKIFLVVAAILFSTFSYAADQNQIEQLTVSCEKQKALRPNDKPTVFWSCNRLQKLLRDKANKENPHNDATIIWWGRDTGGKRRHHSNKRHKNETAPSLE